MRGPSQGAAGGIAGPGVGGVLTSHSVALATSPRFSGWKRLQSLAGPCFDELCFGPQKCFDQQCFDQQCLDQQCFDPPSALTSYALTSSALTLRALILSAVTVSFFTAAF